VSLALALVLGAEADCWPDRCIARVTAIESWIWRLLFAMLTLCAGTGVLAYLLLWILIPADPLIPGHAPDHPQAG
jgi:hypothetical protein